MLGLIKVPWRILFYIFLGLVISFSILHFIMLPRQNAKVCGSYFKEDFICLDPIKYDMKNGICYCTDGEHYLDQDMVDEKNRQRAEALDKRNSNLSKEYYDKMLKASEDLNLSSLVVDKFKEEVN